MSSAPSCSSSSQDSADSWPEGWSSENMSWPPALSSPSHPFSGACRSVCNVRTSSAAAACSTSSGGKTPVVFAAFASLLPKVIWRSCTTVCPLRPARNGAAPKKLAVSCVPPTAQVAAPSSCSSYPREPTRKRYGFRGVVGSRQLLTSVDAPPSPHDQTIYATEIGARHGLVSARAKSQYWLGA